jgi:prepilin-type N-terminal cleavage/methylation domain-containing protein
MSLLRSQKAFTLVELLVVIAIIGVLVSMLLPAVQMVRESARRTTCQNNLRQLGIAVINYETTLNQYPPARAADRFMTWPFYLMPYMEMNNLADELDGRRRYQDQNPSVLKRRVPDWICASRARVEFVSERESRGEPVGPVCDYAGNAGTHEYFLGDVWALFEEPVNGVFNSGFARDNPVENYQLVGPVKGRYNQGSIKDGTSNTIFLGEKYLNREQLGNPGGWGDGCVLNGDEPETFMRLGGLAFGIASSQAEPFSPGELPIFGSAHPTTTNFLLGDGSVHSLTNLTSETTLARLCARNDGQLVSLRK